VTAGIVAPDVSGVVATELGFLSSFASFEDAPLRFEPYQAAFLDERARFRWITKARQVGYSFLFAAEAVARAMLRPGHASVFVSYSLAEAKEKILIARQLYESLPLGLQRRLIVDSKTELAFDSGRRGQAPSRILSHPSKAPRGRRGDIYLDELAHYVADRDVYRGSTALTLRSNGQLTGCSTPLGRRGVFWEIATQSLRPFPHHRRQVVPWWLSSFFCNDVARSAREAPAMPTPERVEVFGLPPIREQFDALTLEDFQQEFEAIFVDETYSYFPYELLLPCTSDDVHLAADPSDLPRPKGRLVAGFDVGRVHDRSELAVFEEADGHYACRMLRAFHNTPFETQEGELRRLLEAVPIARLSIDQTGIGMHLAENLARDYPQVVPEWFTNEAKERWCTDLKIILQRRDLELPRQRDLVAQFHSIKRRVLPSGKVAFEADHTDKGHADRFWAIALAVQRERVLAPRTNPEVTMRVFG
jgi:phage FluMu gp28-like protein